MDPNNIAAIVDKGFSLGILKRYQEAMKYCHKALNLDPSNHQALILKKILERESGGI